ncbi:MAG: hypothetical protein ABH986_01490 [archaeon]
MELKDYIYKLTDEKKKQEAREYQKKAKKQLDPIKDLPAEERMLATMFVINQTKSFFSLQGYEGKRVDEYPYFQQVRAEIEKHFLKKFFASRKNKRIEKPEDTYIYFFFGLFNSLGVDIYNFDEQTIPEKRFSFTTIKTATGLYADICEFLKKAGIPYKKMDTVFEFSPRIRNSISHLDYEIQEDKTIKFFDSRQSPRKLVDTMSSENYEMMLKKIFLLYHGIFIGFFDALNHPELQKDMFDEMEREDEEKKKT